MTKKQSLTIKNKRRFLSALLVSSAFITPAYGMMTDDDRRNHNWSALLSKPHFGVHLGAQILDSLDDQSLGRASQVSTSFRQLTHCLRETHVQQEKKKLYSLILEVTEAEPNEVQRAHDRLDVLLKACEEKGERDTSFVKTLKNLKPRLAQPEFLIRTNNTLFKQLLSISDLQKEHPALKPLVFLLRDLQKFSEEDKSPSIQELLKPLIHHYETYLSRLLSSLCDRGSHLHPKALLSGEGFLENGQGFTSYRVSQDIARSLLSKDQYGLSARINEQGSHAVCFKRSHRSEAHGVHFKGNTTNTGLPVGREFAMYSLAKTLFNRRGRLTPSALLSLNEIEINMPLEGTEAYKAFNEAIKQGKTSEEFFSLFPHYEGEFTQKSPSHILQASFHIEGLSLEDFIKSVEQQDHTYDDIDLTSFSEHIILSMLTNPSDGTPGNFFIRTDLGKPYQIVGVDNDMALELGDIFSENVIPKPGQKIPMTQKHSLRVKNILYCLPLMSRSLALSTVKRILSLNPELCALQWLEQLKLQHRLYEQLKQGKYTSDSSSQRQGDYLSSAQMKDLYLPFLLDPDFVPQFCQKIKAVQTYLQDHMAPTHWQLLLNIHPLSSRFYQEIIKQEKGSPIGVYLKIDPRYRKHDRNFPERKTIYLEDNNILNLEEQLHNGQTIEEALKFVTSRSDGTIKFTQSIDGAAKKLLSTTDLFSQAFLSDFLRSALEGFGYLIQQNTKSELHPSWRKDALLLNSISSGSPIDHIKVLLNLGLNAGTMDRERRTALQYAVAANSSSELLALLKEANRDAPLLPWLNAKASDQLTALDVALERKYIGGFIELIKNGATVCKPSVALKFYKDEVKATSDLALKEAFLKLMKLNDQVRWMICLDEMLPPYTDDQHGTPILSANGSKRLLPNWVKDQIMNLKNQWIHYTHEGNHIVCRATHIINEAANTDHALYFKIYPELPGIEEAVGLLTRKLIGYGAPHTELVRINDVPVLVSHSHGDKTKTLEAVLKNNPQLLKDLDEESLSGLIIVAMLINPGDGKPSNYVVEKHPAKPEKYRIVGVDNDQAFVPAVVRENSDKYYWTGKPIPIAQVKTVLYCLNQMQHPVHPTVRDFFINLCPADILEEWLNELKEVNISYNRLFKQGEHANLFEKHESFVGIPFQKEAISHLYDKFIALRNILSQFPNITHMELLRHLEPRLAKRYERSVTLSSVQERWDKTEAPFYEKSEIGSSTTVTKSGHILKSMDIPLDKSVFESIRKGEGLGPIQALKELEAIKKELETKILEELGARTGNINILKTLQLESTRAKFLEAIDFIDLPVEAQESVISYIQNKQLRHLTLKNCVSLNDNILANAFILSHLVKLDLRGCEGITYTSLVHISKVASILEELNLSNNKNLREIGDIGTFIDAPLIFKTLRLLNLSNCKRLMKVFIKAPELYWLSIESCVLLTDQMLDEVIDGCQKLTALRLTGADKISEKKFREKNPTYTLTNTKLSVQALNNLGLQYFTGQGVSRNYKEALKYYLFAAHQSDAVAQFNIGVMHDEGKGIAQDFEEAIRWYQKAADQGYDQAQYQLGFMYDKGEGLAQNYQEAIKWHKKAAGQGHADAQFALGSIYGEGKGIVQDYQEAMKWYQKAADQEHPNAQFALGQMYEHGKGVSQDYKEAIWWYRKVAAQGHADAQFHLGMMYEDGKGILQNYKEAIKWYRKAVDQEYVAAQFNLGVMYYNGKGVPQNDEEAVKWFQKAADQGNAYAQYNLGAMYECGKGVLQNNMEAVKWWRKAAAQGDAFAQSSLGWMYENGKGVVRNYQAAIKWYLKAADQGNASAQISLGAMYENGKGVLRNYQEAIKWYLKAADQEQADAQAYLGRLYYNGLGTAQNFKEAIKYFRKAADQGNASAQFYLGRMYKHGRAVPQNYEEAIKQYKKAAEQGHVHAQFHLGAMYEQGKGVPQDSKKAIKWYRKAADQGSTNAQFHLGVMYEQGKGVLPEYSDAVIWYKKAANLGHPKAQYTLGRMYETGTGVFQDYAVAVEWYQKAANQENTDAQFSLGVMYYNGKGVLQNYAEAVKWYLKAAEQGNASAQHKLRWMYMYGKGVFQNDEEVVKWFQKAANQGNALAQVNLGAIYEYGKGGLQSYAEAVKWYQKAADQGDANAQNSLGGMYQNGKGVPQNYEEAVKWLQKAADQGDANAQISLGGMYQNGKGVPQNYEEAVKWYQKASDQGNAYAQNNLGWMYMHGKGVLQDDAEALKWFQKAADNKQPFAFYCIAFLQDKGCKRALDSPTSHALYQQAFKLYTETEAHKQSNDQNTLGQMYQRVQGVEKDFGRALECYQKAADQNDGYGQANLGNMYKEGLGIEKDLEMAHTWIKKSAEQKSALGLYYLALMYRDGEGPERDDDKAVVFLNEAAVQNHAEALYTLGWMTEHGRGAEIDLEKAQNYYQEGFKRHAEHAMYAIGRIYEYGLAGEPIDLLKAKEWYQKAADVHYEPAFDKLKSLNQ